MSGHAIKGGSVVCNEPDDAVCRAKWDCECEHLNGIGQEPDGTWTHWAWDGDTDDDVEHQSTGTYDARHCNVCNWINADSPADVGPVYEWVSAHLYDLDLPDGPIHVWWDDDFYAWDYDGAAREQGRFIARLVVARWADDLGLDTA